MLHKFKARTLKIPNFLLCKMIQTDDFICYIQVNSINNKYSADTFTVLNAIGQELKDAVLATVVT